MRLPLVLLLGLLTACTGAAELEPPTSPVVSGEFIVALELAGELAATRSVPVVGPDIGTGAQVTSILPEGTRVTAGTTVLELDRTGLERRLLDAGNHLEVARTRIGQQEAQLEMRLADLAAAVERSDLALQRAEMRITDSEAVPRVEREAARIDVQAASLALDRARASLETARLEGQAQLELLRLESRQQADLVERTRRQLESTSLVASADGVVVHVDAPEGRPVGQGYKVYPGTRVVELADPSDLQVVAWAHELDAARLVVDQPVAVVLEAQPQRTWAGRVARVGDMAMRKASAGPGKRLEVHVALDLVDPSMRPGMSVRAEIQVERLSAALSVPREAVFYDAAGPCVLRRDAEGWGRVPVTAGSSNDTHVVVQGQIAAGDEVALVDPRPGAAVQPLPASDDVGS